MDLKLKQIADYRQSQNLRYRAYDSSLAVAKKQHMIDNMRYLENVKEEELGTLRNMNRAMDDDLKLLDAELKDRQRLDEQLYEEERALQRERENFQADKYLDSIEEQLAKMEQERNHVKGFMQYVIDKDHQAGMRICSNQDMARLNAPTSKLSSLLEGIDKHANMDYMRKKRRDSYEEVMQGIAKGSFMNNGKAVVG